MKNYITHTLLVFTLFINTVDASHQRNNCADHIAKTINNLCTYIPYSLAALTFQKSHWLDQLSNLNQIPNARINNIGNNASNSTSRK